MQWHSCHSVEVLFFREEEKLFGEFKRFNQPSHLLQSQITVNDVLHETAKEGVLKGKGQRVRRKTDGEMRNT